MTTAEENPSLNHVFVFDNVKSNIGSAYDQDSGAPSDRVHVFTWTMHCFKAKFLHIFTDCRELPSLYKSHNRELQSYCGQHFYRGDSCKPKSRGCCVYSNTPFNSIPWNGTVLSSDVHCRSSFSGLKL